MNSILPNYTTSFSNCKGGKNRSRRRKKGCKPTVFAVHKIVTNCLREICVNLLQRSVICGTLIELGVMKREVAVANR